MAVEIDSGFSGEGESAAIAALAARVLELERTVAAMRGGAMRTGAMPAGTMPSVAPAYETGTPPPPPPVAPPSISAPVQQLPPFFQPAARPLPSAPAGPRLSLEKRLGSQVFNMVGILAILIGASWFLKLAIEAGWVGPAARVIIGLLAGAALVVWSESFRRKGLRAFSFTLKAVGSSILYLSLWASFQLYHQMPAAVALLAMLLVTAWNGYMAWTQDAELLAGYGLVGGFLTPLLLSTGGNHETFLFVYVAAIDLAVVWLMRSNSWQRLLLPALFATAVYFVGWYASRFHTYGYVEASHANTWDGESTETALFALLFLAIFAVVSVRGFRRQTECPGEVIVPVLVPLGAALLGALALYFVLQDSGLHSSLAWATIALAALYLGLMRVQATAVSRAIHLAIAIIFLTIAIPLKASGHWLTAAWLVEGLVLFWASTRVEREAGAPSRVLAGLSIAGYLLGLVSLAFHWLWTSHHTSFFNHDLGSAIVAFAALGGAVWLASRTPGQRPPALLAALISIDLVAILLALPETIQTDFEGPLHQNAFANADFVTALLALAVLAAVSWTAHRLGPDTSSTPARGALRPLAGVSGVTVVAFNLLAVLVFVHEIGAFWSPGANDLARSLAISGFLMLYGAGLLAVGFVKQSSFVRWQGLILLLFTIGKVFLYDISGLSQGYRVVSFMALGALLLGVSYAYQKDWLGLKNPATVDPILPPSAELQAQVFSAGNPPPPQEPQ